jgi:hypothetical protein
MTLDEIKKLLWWPRAGAWADDYNNLTRRHDGLLIGHKIDTALPHRLATPDSEVHHGTPRLEFTLDIPALDTQDAPCHVENVRQLGHNIWLGSKKWRTVPTAQYGLKPGVGPAYISLRVLGYLVDCWEIPISGVEITDVASCRQYNLQAISRPTSVLQDIHPKLLRDTQFYWKVGRTAFDINIEATYPCRWRPDQFVQIEYNSQGIDLEILLKHFQQHHRNFFISLVRQQRNEHTRNKKPAVVA